MVKHYVVPLVTATPVRLSSVLSSEPDHQCNAIWMQPRGSNSSLIYVGTTETISSTDYGVRLEVPSGGIPPAPFNAGEFSGSINYSLRSPTHMSDFYVLGTTGDYLHILALWY